MKHDPMVSILVPTSRPDLWPWCYSIIRKQTYPNYETQTLNGKTLSIGAKRNQLLEEVRGKYVVWFDDDDWQHPDKISMLVEAAERAGGAPVTGWRVGWFFRVSDGKVRPFKTTGTLPASAALIRADVARSTLFDERKVVGEDTAWMAAIERKTQPPIVLDPMVHALWLRHAGNTSPPLADTDWLAPERIEAQLPSGWRCDLAALGAPV